MIGRRIKLSVGVRGSRIRIRNTDPGEGEGERMVPQETSMQGAGMGAGGRLDQVLGNLLSHLLLVLVDRLQMSQTTTKNDSGCYPAGTCTRTVGGAAWTGNSPSYLCPSWGSRGSQANHADRNQVSYLPTNLAISIRLGNPFL